MSPGITTGVGGASLDWDRRRRVTPVQTASQGKPGLKLSLWDGIIPLGESRGGTPSDERAFMRREPHRKMRRLVTSICRRSASPFYLREDKSKWRVVDSEAGFSNSRLALDQTPTRIALRGR